MARSKSEKLQCIITASVSSQEKESLVAVARNLDIPYCRIIRQLIRYIVKRQIGWLDLFDKTNEAIAKDETKKVYIRTTLNPELYTAFVQLVEDRGSTTSVVIRRLVLLYTTDKVEWKSIWM